jgi:hypothetical protein
MLVGGKEGFLGKIFCFEVIPYNLVTDGKY